MDMKQYAGEHFLKVTDLDDEPIQKTIAVIKTGKWDKPNCVFEDGDVLSLNVTNSRALLKAYGSDSDGWVGKTIELYVGKVEVRDGDIKDAILVRPVSPPLRRPKSPPQASKTEPAEGDPSEEIPF
jgi:hypothetical protein